jgi:hypothetical protein
VLAHLITEPRLSTAGPLDDTLAFDADDERALAAALAYEAAPDVADCCWIPARRRPNAGTALALA